MTWESKALRYGGTCASCGSHIDVRATGWHSPELKKVRCVACGPPAEEATRSENDELRPDPIGGTAALRESRSRRDPKWVKGAAGEYVLDKFLHREVEGTAR